MRILMPGAVLLAGSIAAQTAQANCVAASNPIDDGDRVVCQGFDSDGLNQELLGQGNLDEITLVIQSGAVLDNSASDERTIELDDDAEIVNRGVIRSEDRDAIEFDNDGFVRNAGRIEGGDEAIQTGADATIINTASGVISAADKGIVTDDEDPGDGDGLTVLNSGLIATVDESIEATEDVFIRNGGFGVIYSEEDDAIQFGSGVVINERNATIESQGGDGIDIDSGEIINRGEISTTADGEAAIDVDEGDGDVFVFNTGSLSGAFGILTDPGNTGSQIVGNSGTISAFDGTALSLGDGRDGLALYGGSLIEGDADFGAGDDMLWVVSRDLSFGADTLLDGGEGYDTVVVEKFNANALTSAVYDSGIFTVAMQDGAVDWTVSLTNWELFQFRNGESITAEELARQLSPVPLPAGGALLLTGLGLLALRRRKS